MEEVSGLLIINPKQDLLSSKTEQEDTIYMFFFCCQGPEFHSQINSVFLQWSSNGRTPCFF